MKNSYVKLKVGKQKSKTAVFRNSEDPVWNEEFVFRVHDLNDELLVSVYKCDDHDHGHGHTFFHVSAAAEVTGRVRIPVWRVAEDPNQTLPPTWFTLERPKSGKSLHNDSGQFFVFFFK